MLNGSKLIRNFKILILYKYIYTCIHLESEEYV